MHSSDSTAAGQLMHMLVCDAQLEEERRRDKESRAKKEKEVNLPALHSLAAVQKSLLPLHFEVSG
jgi:hypothetical protein